MQFYAQRIPGDAWKPSPETLVLVLSPNKRAQQSRGHRRLEFRKPPPKTEESAETWSATISPSAVQGVKSVRQRKVQECKGLSQ